ncbi:MAG: ATP-binding protein, partial [Myxococcota bacterium]
FADTAWALTATGDLATRTFYPSWLIMDLLDHPLAQVPYDSSADHVRDLLEGVRMQLLRYENTLNQVQNKLQAPNRQQALRLSFLFENVEPHRFDVDEEFLEALKMAGAFAALRVQATTEVDLRWEQLKIIFHLSPLEEQILLTCIAPCFSSGFRDALSAAQGGRAPGILDIAFIADLLSFDDPGRWAILDLLQPASKLIRSGMLIPQTSNAPSTAPFPLHHLTPSPILFDFLMDHSVEDTLSNALSAFCALEEFGLPLSELPLDAQQTQHTVRFLRALSATRKGGLIHSRGLDALTVARSLAQTMGQPLLRVRQLDLNSQITPRHPYYQVALVARLFHLFVVIDLRNQEQTSAAIKRQLHHLIDITEGSTRAVMIHNYPEPFELLREAVVLALPRTTAEQRRWVWSDALFTLPTTKDIDIDTLAYGLNTNESSIRQCIQTAHSLALANHPSGRIDQATLLAQMRRTQSSGIEAVAHKVATENTFNDLIIGPACREGLQEVLHFIQHRDQIKDQFPVYARAHVALGALVLFHGPPGTGKTLAASVMARACNRELYRVSLSQIVDKYIGETEKQLERVFTIAEGTDAIILFDEADSLFSKRTKAKSSNDQYSNMRTNFLLQRVESYRGICILTTNNLEAIDQAFRRRIPFQLDFPKPDAPLRTKLWHYFLAQAGLETMKAYAEELADLYDFSGAHIRNAVMKAIIQSMGQGQPISYDILLGASDREYTSIGGLTQLRA